MADVFLSFASNDRRRVKPLREQLIERRLGVWWMHDIRRGESIRKTLDGELAAATNVMLAWSRAADDSPYVEGEMWYAFGKRKLLPVRIEEWPWPPSMSSVQYIDMKPGDDQAEAWRQIEARLKKNPENDEQSVSAAFAHRLVPRSAGPVRTMAVTMAVLALLAAMTLDAASRAVVDDDAHAMRGVESVLLLLLVFAGGTVLFAAYRVWRAWRSRPPVPRGE